MHLLVQSTVHQRSISLSKCFTLLAKEIDSALLNECMVSNSNTEDRNIYSPASSNSRNKLVRGHCTIIKTQISFEPYFPSKTINFPYTPLPPLPYLTTRVQDIQCRISKYHWKFLIWHQPLGSCVRMVQISVDERMWVLKCQLTNFKRKGII